MTSITINGMTEHRLTVGDCVEGMRKLPADSIDVVIASPPYNLGIKYGRYMDSRTSEEYLAWAESWAHEIKRILKTDGSFFLNVGAAPSRPMLPYQLLARLSSIFQLQNTFHWIKSITVPANDGSLVSKGHFKPINSGRFVNDCHEFVFHLTKTGRTRRDRLAVGVPYADQSNVRRWSHTRGRNLRCRGNVWFIPYKTISDREAKRGHPAAFPVELAEFCLKIHGQKPDLMVLDPFLGSGSSAIAAERCGARYFVGIDVDPDYVRLAGNRLKRLSTF